MPPPNSVCSDTDLTSPPFNPPTGIRYAESVIGPVLPALAAVGIRHHDRAAGCQADGDVAIVACTRTAAQIVITSGYHKDTILHGFADILRRHGAGEVVDVAGKSFQRIA
jgi:hypothetical protein